MLLPSVLVGGTVADVFHSRLAQYRKEHPEAMKKLFYQTAGSLFGVALVPGIVVGLFGPWLFSLVFGAQWKISGTIASLMTPWMVMAMTVSPVSRAVFVLGGQRLKLIYDVLLLSSILTLFFLCSERRLDLFQCVTSLCTIYGVLYLVYYLLLTYVVHSRSKREAAGA
jgi:O-antigen/teichoic acid export membrane protein